MARFRDASQTLELARCKVLFQTELKYFDLKEVMEGTYMDVKDAQDDKIAQAKTNILII